MWRPVLCGRILARTGISGGAISIARRCRVSACDQFRHRCAVWNTHVWGARFSLHGSATVAVSPNGHARRTLLVAAELQKAEASGPRAGLSASMAAEAAIGDSCRWVNAVRAMTRPTLTVLLWGITGAAFLGADEVGQAGIVYTATFAETAATLWWFGDRGPRREAR
jgi:hypothetical protein